MKYNTIIFIIAVSLLILIGLSYPQNLKEEFSSGYYCSPTQKKCIDVTKNQAEASNLPQYKTISDCLDNSPDCNHNHRGRHSSGGHSSGRHSGSGGRHSSGSRHDHNSPTKTVDSSGNITFICENTISDGDDGPDGPVGPDGHHHHHHHHHGHHPSSNSFESFDVSPSSCGSHCF